jgi:hypothetical protein
MSGQVRSGQVSQSQVNCQYCVEHCTVVGKRQRTRSTVQCRTVQCFVCCNPPRLPALCTHPDTRHQSSPQCTVVHRQQHHHTSCTYSTVQQHLQYCTVLCCTVLYLWHRALVCRACGVVCGVVCVRACVRAVCRACGVRAACVRRRAESHQEHFFGLFLSLITDESRSL